uniref:Uncharacterized protein n=1 Tax=Chrysemys picta bellii TaxID=8478 RepID=A0A8C3HLG2_CHRPI
MEIFKARLDKWRLIALPLGILCLPLLVTLGILSARVRYSKLQKTLRLLQWPSVPH